MSFAGVVLLGISIGLAVLQAAGRIFFPEAAPPGLTTTIVLILVFGSLNILGVSILGEYLAKVFEEVKRRPHFIRRAEIRGGEIRPEFEEVSLAGSASRHE
jgi:dolichol-phosphate mannosyltransferase